MDKGTWIEGEEFQGGGWDIYQLEEKFYLWETPMFGGEPYLIDNYPTIENAREAAANLT